MRPRIFAFLICLALIINCSTAEAWSYHTHRKLTADAIRLMPEAFQNEFSANKAAFLKGSTDPDTLIKDFTNHVYHPDGSMVDGLYRIQDLYTTATAMIRSGAEPEKTAYILGLMSHYIADLNQPLHTAGSERNPDESEFHTRYERDLNSHLRELELPQANYRPVTSVEERVKEMTGIANRDYSAIEQAYQGGKGLSEVMEMSKRQLAASTCHIVDFWLGACREAGKTFNGPAPSLSADATNAWNSDESTAPETGEQININSASAEQLAKFFNIELPKARRLVDARPFNSAYDLAKVQGFTVHFVKRHRDRIRLR
jgi:DNA uptake protein ComE-like DNA-binding protein